MAFVGRETELDLLTRELTLALELGSGRSLFVQGPPGTGKTALVTEFLERVAREHPETIIARGRCLQTFGSADPYLPFVDALRDLSDETTSGSVRGEALGTLITELAPYWLSVIPMVGGLLSAGFATAARLRGGGGAAAPSKEALFVQYLELIRRLAQQSPLVLLLDDLHWADHSSVALLNHVAHGIGSLPVLILGTLRSDEADLERHPITGLIRELERESVGRTLALSDLGSGDLKGLLRAEFGGDVAEPLHRWVEETAGGNPLFASELARLLRQSGAVVETRGEWHLTDAVAELGVPRSAEAVIETRIQRLEPDEVRVLQYASVEGNEFSSVVLAGLLDQDELDVLDVLERIERRYQLVRTVGETELPDGEISTTLQFRHALVQTVLYRQVLGKRRILLHRKAGESLERLYGEAADAVAGKLARHFHQGRVDEQAYRYACSAASSARRIYAHWETEELTRIALEHSPGPAETAALQERLGDVYQTVGYYDRGMGCFQAALEQCSEADLACRIRLRRKMAVIERKAGLTPAPALLQKLRSLLTEADAVPRERCELLLEAGFLPNAVNVADTAREAVALAEAMGDSTLLAKALEQLAVALIFGGQPAPALPFLEKAFAVGGGATDPMRGARYFNILGIAYTKLGQYRQARQAFEQMLKFSERLGDSHFIAAACSNLGCELLKLGEYGAAEEALQRARIIHERRDRAMLVQSLFNLAKRAHWAGDLALARERYTTMLEHARELDYWTSEVVACAGIGLCHLEAGEIAAAREVACRATAVAADREEWFEDREFLEILLASLEAHDGDPRAAASRLERAAACVAEADFFAHVQVQLERVRILRRCSAEEARAVLEEVVAATRGIEFALDGEVERLRATLQLSDPLTPTLS